MSATAIDGWARLRHGGLLLDAPRLRQIVEHVPSALSSLDEQELRRQASGILGGGDDIPAFITFVLQKVCGFSESTGTWHRGSQVSVEWGRVAVTGETIKPRQIWHGRDGGSLPVFIDKEQRVGIGRGRRVTSQVLQWLRAGGERLALVTNGRQWRLVFAGLDFDAWCEWDLDLWFEEGGFSPQVAALRTLFQPGLWASSGKGVPAPLLQAILDSRKGQAELSAVLGERVREAVEILVQSHGEVLKEGCADVAPAEIYRAAVRVIMRMVVVLFAESRDLLRRDNALYHGSYGLTGLLDELEKIAARGGNRLVRSWSAWPRVLALFRLVHAGSHHPGLPIPAYGGELFAPGEPSDLDGLSRALAVFETACYEREVLPDKEMHRILEHITRTRVKVRQGRSSIWVPAPVDFSDLSSEYIGILYEGLLDFELKTAPAGDPIVFLAVGNQPALPLSRLEAMDDKALTSLLERMKDTSQAEEEGEDDAERSAKEEVPEDEASDNGDEPPEEIAAPSAAAPEPGDPRHATRTRAEIWARRAVVAGKLAPKVKGAMTPEKRLVHEEAVSRKARQLVPRVVLPGEWYLIRWGGTRKGAGTFYTRPGLAVPTVQRTLRPLAYNPPLGAGGEPDRDATPSAWTPRKPEEILALKVADPACGSGSFPVAALRFLTEALYASLHHHGRIREEGDRSVVALLTGTRGAQECLTQELLPCRPDDPLFELRLKAILRRHVVERCIYGVDLDPLAVELCRLALWIETMDRTLPFSFLDHKIKCGNSLVGTWFDQFQHYPAMAFKNREGGDKGHTNGVHFEKESRTKAIRAFTKERLTPDLADALRGQMRLFAPPSGTLESAHDQALTLIERLHALPVHHAAERARIYREELLGAPAYRSLKEAMDLWCACWFWPAEEINQAPLPSNLARPSEETRAVAARIATTKRFFHWELEFPDVYCESGSGFHAVIGNPPWETLQPNAEEFFSNVDPLFRAYGNLVKRSRLNELFEADRQLEINWLNYNSDFNGFSHWVGHCARPFGDPDEGGGSSDSLALGQGSKDLHSRWRNQRCRSKGYTDREHPFRQQMGRMFTYKLFLEQSQALLRDGGRLGQIVPSGIYSDAWSQPLRELFLDRCQWEWLFGFENREKIFEIDGRFKFNPIILEKGGKTEAIHTAFMRFKIEDWECAESLATLYSRSQIERFSPNSKTIIEIQSQRDLEILEKVYAQSVLLGDKGSDGWGIKFKLEFMMNTDAPLFPPRQNWEELGYRPDEYSRWLKGKWCPIAALWSKLGVKSLPSGCRRSAQPPYNTLPISRVDIPAGIILSREANAWMREEDVEDVALPMYVGKMAFLNDWAAGNDAASEARQDLWPDFLLASKNLRHNPSTGARLVFRDITNATNERSFIVALVPGFPCGNLLPVLEMPHASCSAKLQIVTYLASSAFDWAVRQRLSGTHLNWHITESLALPKPSRQAFLWEAMAARLNLSGALFSPDWLALHSATERCGLSNPTPHERLRLRVGLDALAATAFGLSSSDLEYILQGCDEPLGSKVDRASKGFWRVDKDKDPELRYTVLTFVAFHDLEEKIRACGGDREKGTADFLSQNNGEGWMLPQTLCLSDYGLGRDDRAKLPQPVASRLGPRFYDWQLAQSAEESWRECHLHARNLLGDAGYRKLLADVEAEKRGEKPSPACAEPPAHVDKTQKERQLFD